MAGHSSHGSATTRTSLQDQPLDVASYPLSPPSLLGKRELTHLLTVSVHYSKVQASERAAARVIPAALSLWIVQNNIASKLAGRLGVTD
jgi:hypothetical protein